jgi:SAM-dependent methyltransferase
MMGPNVLWLAEWASRDIGFQRGMRVLDLGCGKAASSIFIAKEFGATVWAADLWINPTENWTRIEAAGLADRVFPLQAEAHALPFADNYFDVIVSFDAFHYFGTDDLYVGYVSRFLRPGGALCVVSPGLATELRDGPPGHLLPFWDWQFGSFHSPAGGAITGPKPASSTMCERTGCQRVGGTGPIGASFASRSAPVVTRRAGRKKRRCCDWTPAERWGSRASRPAPDRGDEHSGPTTAEGRHSTPQADPGGI